MLYSETYINKKIIIRNIVFGLVIAWLFIVTYFIGKTVATKQIGKAAFTDAQTIQIEETWENPYKDLVNDEIAFYIIERCKSIKLDPNIPIAILLKENPKQDPLAVNKNSDGSTDCGLFQINSANLIYFADLYWAFEKFEPFDWSNWQHNAWVAINLINDLYHSFDEDLAKAVAAYNAGCGRVIANKIPESTKLYQTEVLNNYKMLSS